MGFDGKYALFGAFLGAVLTYFFGIGAVIGLFLVIPIVLMEHARHWVKQESRKAELGRINERLGKLESEINTLNELMSKLTENINKLSARSEDFATRKDIEKIIDDFNRITSQLPSNDYMRSIVESKIERLKNELKNKNNIPIGDLMNKLSEILSELKDLKKKIEAYKGGTEAQEKNISDDLIYGDTGY